MKTTRGRSDADHPGGAPLAAETVAGLLRVGMAISISVLLAWTMPAEIRLAALAALLRIAAFVAATAAALGGDRPLEPRLTRWDEAVFMLAVGTVCDWLAPLPSLAQGG